jgi:LemA protein
MSEIVVVLLMAITVWGILIYNRLVRDKNRVLAAWSDIDVQLKRRYDLIPKLVDLQPPSARQESGVGCVE